MFRNYDGVLTADDEVGYRKTDDWHRRPYLTMTELTKRTDSGIRGSGKTMIWS